jgi:hypothetical protein
MQPETEPPWLGCGILAQPHLVICEHTTPPPHHHLVHTTTPPHTYHHPTSTHRLRRHSTQRTQNRATTARFCIFGSPASRFVNAQPHHHTTTTTTIPPLCTTLRHRFTWLGFILLVPPPCVSCTHHPTTTSSYAPLHHIPLSRSASVPNGVPEIVPFSMAHPKPSLVAWFCFLFFFVLIHCIAVSLL